MCVMSPRCIRSMRKRWTPARRTWAPISRMRAAPRCFASTRRRPRIGSDGCSNGGSGASSGRMTDRSRSCCRWASGWTWRRERSKVGYGIACVGLTPWAFRGRAEIDVGLVCLEPVGQMPDVLESSLPSAPELPQQNLLVFPTTGGILQAVHNLLGCQPLSDRLQGFDILLFVSRVVEFVHRLKDLTRHPPHGGRSEAGQHRDRAFLGTGPAPEAFRLSGHRFRGPEHGGDLSRLVEPFL